MGRKKGANRVIDANKGKVYNGDLHVKDKRGRNNSFFGKKHGQETKQKMALAKAGKYFGSDNPNYGKKASNDTKVKMTLNRAKLSLDQVIEIKQLLAYGVAHKEIAARFGVSRPQITRISSGARWTNISKENYNGNRV